MYLSKLTFDPSVKGKELEPLKIDNLYSHHQFLWSCFDSGSNQEQHQADFIYRTDIVMNTPVIHILSNRKIEQSISGWKLESKEFEFEIEQGQLIQFSFRANPTIDIKSDGGRSKRHDVVMHAKKQAKAQQLDTLSQIDLAAKQWLLKRAELFGVEFKEQTIEYANYQQHTFKKGDEQLVKISTLDYQGILTVKDPEKFQQALVHGIGRSKAFGCGLMMIKRI